MIDATSAVTFAAARADSSCVHDGRSTLSFDVVEGSDAAYQTVGLKLPSGTDYVGLTETSAEPDWVGYSYQGNAMKITVHPQQLLPGTHSVTLDLCAPDSFGDCVDTASLAVTVNVREAPIVTPASYSLKRTAVADQPVTFEVPLDARHASWSIASDSPWVTPVSATVADARSASFSVDSRALAAGQHTARVQMTSSSGASQVLAVDLDLAAWVIDVAPVPYALSTIAGKASGAINNLSISHNANDAQPITVAARQDWLKVSLIDYGKTAAMTIHAEPGATMSPGNYTGQIDVTVGQGATSITRSVDIQLAVSALNIAPSIARIDAALFAGVPSNYANGSGGGLVFIGSVTNLPSQAVLTYTSSVPWIAMNTSTPTLLSDTRFNIGSVPLPSGTYTGEITAHVTLGNWSTTSVIPVTLTLTPASLSIFDFYNQPGTAGTASMPAQRFSAELSPYEVGPTDVQWTTTTPWLVLSQTTSRTGTLIMASMSASAGLGAGTHAADVTATTRVGGDVLTRTFTFNLVLN